MNDWLRAELSEGKESEIPVIGQSVALYCRPLKPGKGWRSDIGSLYVEGDDADALIWGSAFGLDSGLDGVQFEDILRDYEVCFTEVPPLEAGRFPSPLGIPVAGVSTPS